MRVRIQKIISHIYEYEVDEDLLEMMGKEEIEETESFYRAAIGAVSDMIDDGQLDPYDFSTLDSMEGVHNDDGRVVYCGLFTNKNLLKWQDGFQSSLPFPNA